MNYRFGPCIPSIPPLPLNSIPDSRPSPIRQYNPARHLYRQLRQVQIARLRRRASHRISSSNWPLTVQVNTSGAA